MKYFSKQTQRGFTLVELVVVVSVVGVLAAVAAPKFVSVGDTARQSTVDGAAKELSDAATRNQTTRTGNLNSGIAVANCRDVSVLVDGVSGADSGYLQIATYAADGSVTYSASAKKGAFVITSTSTTADVTTTCTVSTTATPTLTATFSVVGKA